MAVGGYATPPTGGQNPAPGGTATTDAPDPPAVDAGVRTRSALDGQLSPQATAGATGRCVDDRDCPQGARCNTMLAPPACQLVRCAPPGSACSTDDVCQTGLRCHKGACKLCDVCGDKCEVDFNTDPKNCGACGNALPAGIRCVDGAASCPGPGLTLCGSQCVNLATDPKNCGECGNAVNTLSDPANCGACGKTCARAAGDKCSGGQQCTRVARGGNNTCGNICRLQGLDCVDGGNHRAGGAAAPDACDKLYDTPLYCECAYAPQ
jgi:hypothetical protein